MTATTDHLALLAAIRDNPDEDTPRLMLADYLDENDLDPARAELIRVQCELASQYPHVAGGNHSRWRYPARFGTLYRRADATCGAVPSVRLQPHKSENGKNCRGACCPPTMRSHTQQEDDMTIREYLSPQLFPLTTQPGLTLEQQMALDAVNYDEYEEARTAYARLSDHERAVGRELEAKNAARDSVLRQAQGEQGSSSGTILGTDGRPMGR